MLLRRLPAIVCLLACLQPSNKPKDSLSTALSQSEGLSDFRTVLRSSSPLPTRKEKAKVEQHDFRGSLRRSEKTAVKGKDTPDKGPRQEDFRSNLRRSIKTKDTSSAAVKGHGKQEDFRSVLKKSDSKPGKQTTRRASTEDIEQVLTREEHKPEKKSPPAVKSKRVSTEISREEE